jgi:catechol 2,3-dioxygenase-like lactoylglutathione lyase family enzyme
MLKVHQSEGVSGWRFKGESVSMSNTILPLPLELGHLDHYTLIVEDAKEIARFHSEILGFEELRIQLVNAGSVPEGEHDMLNHVMGIPGTANRVMVVTEGLTEDSIFRRYLDSYGPGVHHVAYEVEDIEAAMTTLHAKGIKTTSKEVLHDPLTGLRQVFINREYSGYFIELIERTEASASGSFTNQNMAGLAKTMLGYLEQRSIEDHAAVRAPGVDLDLNTDEVLAYLLDPFNLPKWTGHRLIREIDGRVVEVRMHGDVPLDVTGTESGVTMTWTLDQAEFCVQLTLSATASGCHVEAVLPDLPEERLDKVRRIIQTELNMLAAELHGQQETITAEDRQLVDEYHLEVHQRVGL